ncbi:MAG: FixH family protein [Chloroflexota bacterium]|nr:FixH family protein [Chloroflexota bacterium]
MVKWTSLVVFMIALLLAGCRESAQPTPTAGATLEQEDIDIEMAVEPAPAAVGDATLLVTLHDRDGVPIDDATVAVRGDMTHAGMVPVLGDATGGTNGEYRIPFEWTMGGDWIITVDVTLANGVRISRVYEMTVQS